MTAWQKFYKQIKDVSWPECNKEEEFSNLPKEIQTEIIEFHGYSLGSFARQSKLPHRIFPIKTQTACQLKWNWSTVFLMTETTASCHRTHHHKFDVDTFNFHNTASKQQDRQRMLDGQWPERGCEYCQNIESAGGNSDRITNLDLVGMHAPPELEINPTATAVTPRILEVYFDNTCNLKCLYCGPHFSSLWDAENIKWGQPAFVKSSNFADNKLKLFEWIKKHGHHLTAFNILGGEPLYQPELEQCLNLFEQYPAPELKLQMFTNLNAKLSYVKKIVQRVQQLIDKNCIREFEITASLDCWGPEQEYVRFPLNLEKWEQNFNYLLKQQWINLIIGSTVTPLTIKTLPQLLEKINQWNQIRPVYHYQNSVNSPSYMFIDIFGDIFSQDFDQALALKPESTPEQRSSKNYLLGIAKQASSNPANIQKITKLFNFLNTMDQRRNTHWPTVFPWLVPEFARHGLTTKDQN